MPATLARPECIHRLLGPDEKQTSAARYSQLGRSAGASAPVLRAKLEPAYAQLVHLGQVEGTPMAIEGGKTSSTRS